MPTNHVGQYIANTAYSRARTTWLIEHGFNVPPGRTNPHPSILQTPSVWSNEGPESVPVTPAWAPGFGPPQTQPDPTPPPGMGFHTGEPVQTLINTFTSYKPVKIKVDKNRMYNRPLHLIRRMKGGVKKGEIGLEIECEGMNLVTGMVDYWLCHQDNSLRPVKDHPPQEYVLREPLDRKDVPKALKYLTAKLKAAGSELVYSHRTSVHVHLNCQQLTLQEIYKIWCLYMVFEEILIEFSGPDRPGNLFCLGSKQAEYQVQMMLNAVAQENFEEIFSDNLRYTSCNVASLNKFGSLEFRSMRGTVDQGLIQSWIDILCIIKDKALEYSNPQEIVKDFQRLNAEGFMKKTFYGRDDIIAILGTYKDLHKKLWDGLRLMRDVAYAVTWEPRVLEDKKKDQEEIPNLVNSHPGLMYTVLIDPDDIGFIQSHGISTYEYQDGDYAIINYSQGVQAIPQSLGTGTWPIHPGRKAVFTATGAYWGSIMASQEELNIGNEISHQNQPAIEPEPIDLNDITIQNLGVGAGQAQAVQDPWPGLSNDW